MIVSVGKAGYFHAKGCDGIVDISPFTCMNGIVSESVYPRMSNDLDGIPIRNFFFDGKAVDREADIEIFLELARSYQARKPRERTYPPAFS
jgi:predicted nucleotide-binding protein (sugar kinase/HSP70/actin superfamily)